MSDGTDTQVGTQMINECRIKIAPKRLYNERNLQEERREKKKRERKSIQYQSKLS